MCVPNKTRIFKPNLSVFNIVTGIEKLKTLRKHISCDCKCKFDIAKSESNQCWNNNKCRCECNKIQVCQKRLYL